MIVRRFVPRLLMLTAALMLVGAASGQAAANPHVVRPRAAAIAVGAPTLQKAALASACADVLFVGARGSGEGASGYGNFVGKTKAAFHTVFIGSGRIDEARALDYPANAVPLSPVAVGPFLDSIATGVRNLNSLLDNASRTCPHQRFVLAGYSQGAMVVHQVLTGLAASMQTSLLSRIDGVVLLADGVRARNTRAVTLGGASDRATGIALANWVLPLWQSPLYSFGTPKDVPIKLVPHILDVCNDRDIVCDNNETVSACWRVASAILDACTAAHAAEIAAGVAVHKDSYVQLSRESGTWLGKTAHAYLTPKSWCTASPSDANFALGCTALTATPGVPFTEPIPVLVNASAALTIKVTSGALPSGLAVKKTDSGYVLTGTTQTAGIFNSVLTITRSGGYPPLRIAVTLTVVVPEILNPVLADATLGIPYQRALASSLPGALRWASDGTLPAGLTLSPTGVIAGTPRAAGTFAFGVVVSTAAGQRVRAVLVLRVVDAANSSGSTGDHFASSKLVSGTAQGAPIGGQSWPGGVSDDGQWAIFGTNSGQPNSPLVSAQLKNLGTGELSTLASGQAGYNNLRISGDGEYVTFPDVNKSNPRNPIVETVIQRRSSGERIVPKKDGGWGLPAVPNSRLSANGRYLFLTTHVVHPAGTTFSNAQILRYDRVDGSYDLASILPSGQAGFSPSIETVAPDGLSLTFGDWARPNARRLFHRDLVTRVTTLVDPTIDSYQGAVSENGHWLASLVTASAGIQLIDLTSGQRTILPVASVVAGSCPSLVNRAWPSGDGSRVIFSGCAIGAQEQDRGLWVYDVPNRKIITIKARGLGYVQPATDAQQILYTATSTGGPLISTVSTDMWLTRW